MEELVAKLAAHEQKSQERFETLREGLEHLRAAHHGERKMDGGIKDEVKVYNNPPSGGSSHDLGILAALFNNRPSHGYGDGLGLGGGGILGGLLLGALLNGRGGLLGGRDGEFAGGRGCGPSEVTTRTDLILQDIGSVKAAIPLAESQIQLALAGAKDSIIGQITQTKDVLSAQNNAQTIATLQGFNGVDRGLCELGKSITASVVNEGEKTRALVGAIDRENLNRALGDARAEIIELRNEGRGIQRARETEVTVTQNVNQNQQQQQQQTQFNALIEGMHRLLAASQVIQAQNSAINIGGLQSASPTNTNTQVR